MNNEVKSAADDPTRSTYAGLADAFDFFNRQLFDGRLPTCLITMQRGKKFYGFFASRRFGTRAGDETRDEIALNPSYFRDRSTAEVLSTLVHEMTHVEQQHFGKPSRAGYHNKEWSGLMKRVGLIASDTGRPGGKQTGQKVSHYIEEGGPFARAFAELEEAGFALRYVELWGDEAAARKKAASKTKYTCGGCEANAWAKPNARLLCGDCDEPMEARA